MIHDNLITQQGPRNASLDDFPNTQAIPELNHTLFNLLDYRQKFKNKHHIPNALYTLNRLTIPSLIAITIFSIIQLHQTTDYTTTPLSHRLNILMVVIFLSLITTHISYTSFYANPQHRHIQRQCEEWEIILSHERYIENSNYDHHNNDTSQYYDEDSGKTISLTRQRQPTPLCCLSHFYSCRELFAPRHLDFIEVTVNQLPTLTTSSSFSV